MSSKEGRTVFILGGARSGKSAFALRAASACAGRKAYIATAQALDNEMAERIIRHKEERSGEWTTFEEPLDIAALIGDICKSYDVLIIDCLTLWASNLLLAGRDAGHEVKVFTDALAACGARLYIVSNEVGLGIVPDNPLSRRFRDLSGSLNQKVAGVSDEVYLITAGIPLRIK